MHIRTWVGLLLGFLLLIGVANAKPRYNDGYKFYGNWGGPGWSNGKETADIKEVLRWEGKRSRYENPPVDKMDEACQTHDIDWALADKTYRDDYKKADILFRNRLSTLLASIKNTSNRKSLEALISLATSNPTMYPNLYSYLQDRSRLWSWLIPILKSDELKLCLVARDVRENIYNSWSNAYQKGTDLLVETVKGLPPLVKTLGSPPVLVLIVNKKTGLDAWGGGPDVQKNCGINKRLWYQRGVIALDWLGLYNKPSRS